VAPGVWTDLPFEALTSPALLSQRERREMEKQEQDLLLSSSFSLLSLWERRAGEVRASKGTPHQPAKSL